MRRLLLVYMMMWWQGVGIDSTTMTHDGATTSEYHDMWLLSLDHKKAYQPMAMIVYTFDSANIKWNSWVSYHAGV